MPLDNNIRKVIPYTPGEQPKVTGNIIKLNTNEFPYPPSPYVKDALDCLNDEVLKLYPSPTAAPLTKAIAKHYGFEEDEVFVGVGSDDVLSVCFLTFFDSDKPVLFPDITYSFYDVWASVYRIPYKQVPLDDDFKINKEDYLQENGGIIFANPNAPTGICLSLDEVEYIVSHNADSVVIVDEAYVDFGGESAMELTRKYDNLIVVQTFSKSRAMAGVRIGFAIGNKTLIKYLNDVKFSINSYTMNQMAIAAGKAAIDDDLYFENMVAEVVKTREYSKLKLEELGFKVLDSKANFLFATHERSAKDIFEHLKSKNIYVRYFDKPRIDNYLRITIGTKDQMNALIKELGEYLS